MSLFISVYNHEEEDGRYTAESFCELPDYDEVCDGMWVVLLRVWKKDVELCKGGCEMKKFPDCDVAVLRVWWKKDVYV